MSDTAIYWLIASVMLAIPTIMACVFIGAFL